ncbi:MAG: ATP-dependent DNA helicase Rep [Nitrosomonadaceae bacterium]|nr:ATP-dependent DNA helicase Rep [Nitrosomonadaceae bacterium]
MRQARKGDPDRSVTAITLSKLLAHYMQDVGDNTHAKTYHSWLLHYWKKCTGSKPPEIRSYEYDFSSMIGQAENISSTNPAVFARWNWGHLVIDEAQDLPLPFFELLQVLMTKFEAEPTKTRPVLTVLLDDNQTTRFTRNPRVDTNERDVVTINRIKEDFPALVYELRKNHRNTSEVSKFSSHFYIGTTSGIAEPSSRAGDVPRLRTYQSNQQLAAFVFSQAQTKACAVGVFLDLKSQVKELMSELETIKRNDLMVKVQSFLSKEGDVTKIVFDTPGGSVTVMCRDSAKGLEFDIAVIGGLDTMSDFNLHDDDAKMALYVLTTRPRQELVISWMGTKDGFMRRCGSKRFPPLGGPGPGLWNEGEAL